MQQLIDLLRGPAADSTALIEPLSGRVWSFAELDEQARRMAALAASVGAPGATIAVVGANHPLWIDAYYGIPAAGRIASFVNHRLSPRQIIESIERSKAGLVLADDPIHVGDTSVVRFADAAAALADVTPIEDRVGSENDVAWHIPTSGTSGRAKIVQLTHGSILAAARTTIAARPMSGDEVYLFPFPLCHVAGYNVVMFHLCGRPVVLVARFDPAEVLDAIERYRVTHISLAPTMIVDLLDHLAVTGRPAPASLRAITYGSAAIDRDLLMRAIEVLGCDFAQGYGMTELSGNAVFLSPDDHRRGLAAAGRPGPGVEIRLLDDAGGDAGRGPGEVAVRAAQVMRGYLDDDAANAETFVDLGDGGPWMRTGDVGRLDEAGYLSLVDRKKDIIISGGENIASREVEEAMRRHPAVADVAVIGIPDTRWGEMVCAVVVRAEPVEAGELLDFARVNIGGFKKPRRIHFVETLPRTASGKVVKPELRRLLGP